MLFAMGGLAGYLIVPARPGGAHDPGLVVQLAGQRLPLGADAARTGEAVRAIAREHLRGRVTIAVPGSSAEPRAWSRDALGVELDAARAASLVREVRDPASALRRAHAANGGAGALDLPVPVRVDDARALAAILALKDETDVPPVSARIDLEAHAPLPERAGTRLDAYATLAALDDAVARGEGRITAVTEAVMAPRTLAQIEGVGYDTVLGAFATKYDEAALDEGRAAELRRQASLLNGAVILSGETFDFVEAVGAPGAGSTGLTQGSASGKAHAPGDASGARNVSLLAGTAHAAAFFAGMDLVERHPLKRPSAFLPMGLDARVAYPNVTLRFKNPYAHAVVLHVLVSGAVPSGPELRVEILGPARSREVTFVRKVNDALPFAEREIEDPKIPRGARVLAQRGIPGFAVTRYRIVREGGAAVQERLDERYAPSPQIWRKGTGEPDRTWKPHPDPRPEYLADASLTLRQPPLEGGEAGGGASRALPLLEARVPGASGTPGFSARLKGAKAHVAIDDAPGVGSD